MSDNERTNSNLPRSHRFRGLNISERISVDTAIRLRRGGLADAPLQDSGGVTPNDIIKSIFRNPIIADYFLNNTQTVNVILWSDLSDEEIEQLRNQHILSAF